MSGRARGWVLVLVQLVLVLSVAGKFVYERWTRPRVWVRATQLDPSLALRGRYLGLQLLVNGCGLPRDKGQWTPAYKGLNGVGMTPGSMQWDVVLGVAKGQLVPRVDTHPHTPGEVQQVTVREDQTCERAPLRSDVEYFLPDTARGPFPLKAGQELWVEVTVPPSGPPRPIQLATSGQGPFQTLRP